MSKYLTLWLEGPLQAWGYNSYFGSRKTLPFPTRSGLSGMLLAAAGASGSQEDLLKILASCKLTVFCFNDSSTMLTDYQVVGNGYDTSNAWQNRMSPKKADGKASVGGGGRITYRDYLQDRHFAVIWEMPDDTGIHFADALQHPVYDIYLGRKNCLPSALVLVGCFNSRNDACTALQERAMQCILPNGKFLQVNQQIDEVETIMGDAYTMTLPDIPLCFGLHKVYSERIIRIVPVTSIN